MMKKLTSLSAVLIVIFCCCEPATAKSRSGTSTATAREAVRFLKTVPRAATLAQIKNLLPRGSWFMRAESTNQGAWTWNSIRFGGKINGVLVFANTRRETISETGRQDKAELEKQMKRVALLQADDTIHYIQVFLGKPRANFQPTAIRAETKRYRDAITRHLGKPVRQEYAGDGDGPGEIGWSADWRLPDKRFFSFYEYYALHTSDIRPLLTMGWEYSHLYRE